ncbi:MULTISPECIES: aldo/keto reductase [Aerococcus]|uniref:aldo/keto reductase n=1 Tax=Aerococcus urinae (strain CCUG 59500 / ACS-120-V-Col10a) TaxID=2976812 RepID=UPI000200F3E6|nr:aldo/keto reductase [Aerococcus sp. Group 1]AEA00739.1 oxidoreductase, aldo/keto reductase family protein [Aerococcus sp. Group 1]MCY3030326.1 aldo/keto reductase [Aerococcus sp. Group 1]MCY3055423.1 aldo/keto reductase [Aerococcus sp. Group 1]MCY3057153.1 aldo/keto reductase [Aerococcus sp. Group 1]MCY3061515.1 aldo/keto reductase [Aerococcus sp. Group 1]
MKTYKLSNSVEIPAIGFGTWKLEEGDMVVNAVSYALEVGYRHIDTAQYYGNEHGVGQAIKKSPVPREDIFLTTKVWNDKVGYEDTLASFEESLEKLGTDYVDLLLIHWPNPKPYREEPGYKERNAEVWRALETIYEKGQAKAIGLSNFLPYHLDALLESAKVIPMVNQIKLTPGLVQEDIVNYCKKHNILLEGYSPLGSGEIFDNEEVQAIADRLGYSVAQIALAWSLKHGFVPLPRSKTPENIKANLDVFDIQLTDRDMELLDTVADVEAPDPDSKPF